MAMNLAHGRHETVVGASSTMRAGKLTATRRLGLSARSLLHSPTEKCQSFASRMIAMSRHVHLDFATCITWSNTIGDHTALHNVSMTARYADYADTRFVVAEVCATDALSDQKPRTSYMRTAIGIAVPASKPAECGMHAQATHQRRTTGEQLDQQLRSLMSLLLPKCSEAGRNSSAN